MGGKWPACRFYHYRPFVILLLLLAQTPCEGTGSVKQGSLKHNAYLSGRFLGDVAVLARMQVTAEEVGAGGCTLKIGIRAADAAVSELLINAIA